MSEGASASSGGNTGQSQGQGRGAAQGVSQAATASPSAAPSQGDGAAITAQHSDPAAEKTATPQTEAQKKRLADRLKEILPDKEINDDNYEDEGIRYIDELHEYRNKNREYNKKILDVFDAEPAVVDIIRDMSQGASFMEALAKNVDITNIQPQAGDPDYAKWDAALKQRETKRLEKENKAKQVDDNISFTTKEFQAFRQENNLDDARTTEFVDKVTATLNDVFMGKYTKDFLSLMYKGLNFDKAVKTAQAQGEIKGRNEKIKAERSKEDLGDGLPNLTQSGEIAQREETPEDRLAKTIDGFTAKRKTLADFLKKP